MRSGLSESYQLLLLREFASVREQFLKITLRSAAFAGHTIQGHDKQHNPSQPSGLNSTLVPIG